MFMFCRILLSLLSLTHHFLGVCDIFHFKKYTFFLCRDILVAVFPIALEIFSSAVGDFLQSHLEKISIGVWRKDNVLQLCKCGAPSQLKSDDIQRGLVRVKVRVKNIALTAIVIYFNKL